MLRLITDSLWSCTSLLEKSPRGRLNSAWVTTSHTYSHLPVTGLESLDLGNSTPQDCGSWGLWELGATQSWFLLACWVSAGSPLRPRTAAWQSPGLTTSRRGPSVHLPQPCTVLRLSWLQTSEFSTSTIERAPCPTELSLACMCSVPPSPSSLHITARLGWGYGQRPGFKATPYLGQVSRHLWGYWVLTQWISYSRHCSSATWPLMIWPELKGC